MIYLDYSATTPVNEDVLNTYVLTTKQYIGNPNSLHKLGFEGLLYLKLILMKLFILLDQVSLITWQLREYVQNILVNI